MKKTFALLYLLVFAFGIAQAQDVYFAGNNNGTGKIWKNNMLIYSISSENDSTIINSMIITPDSTVYAAGTTYNATTDEIFGRIWMGDTIVYTAEAGSVFNRLLMSGNSWTAAGFSNDKATVWQNDSVLYTQNDTLNSYAYALTMDGDDIYYGGEVIYDDTLGIHIATLWKNSSMLWQEDYNSSILDLYHDGTDLYAAGYFHLEGLLFATLWKNDSILFSINDLSLSSVFTAIDTYDGNIYLAGLVEDSLCIWLNGEVLYSHQFTDEYSNINALTVNEYGVYYAGLIDGVATVWKDGEILYQPENCDNINDLIVLPSTPQPSYTLTVEADNTDWGTVSGSGTYPLGDTVTIQAFPNAGCEFLYWNDSITDNPRDIVITQDSIFTAHFGRIEYTIETSCIPENAGTISGGGVYHYGDTVTLEAMANDGFIFKRWNDSITDNPRDIIVSQDSTFIAHFDTRQYTITVVSDHPAWGSVTGGGTYNYGDTIEIVATANMSFAFAGWTDGIMDNPRTVIVIEDYTYTAHFEIRQCTITTEVYPENSGIVNGGGTYDYGEIIRLTAHGNTGYVFNQWNDGEMTNPRIVFVEGDATYTAVFTPLQYEITTSCDPDDGGTVSGGGIYDYGSTAILTATPNENFIFLCWNDGIASNPRNVIVHGNASYKALFMQNSTPTYIITVLSNNPSLGTVSGGGEYPQGSTIEITATPSAEAIFSGWDDGNTDNPRSITVTSNMTFTAIFTSVQNYTITVSSENPLLGSTYGSGTYPANSTVIIGAEPAPNCYFSGWQDGDMNNPRTIVVTGDAEYIASFSSMPVQTYTVTVYYDEIQGFVLGAGTYNAGSTATLAAIPADGYIFVKWNDESTDNPKKIFVDHDISLAAFFNYTGVDENGGSIISLFPNPANDKIRIEGMEGSHKITIYNSLGMIVKTVDINDEDEINVGNLRAGIYLVRIDNRHTLKFIKAE